MASLGPIEVPIKFTGPDELILLNRLIESIQSQTEAISRLAASNEALVVALINSDDSHEGAPPKTFLDGSRIS